jgi:hypothetical protein
MSDDDDFDEIDFKNRKKRISYLKSDENPNLKLVLDEHDDDEREREVNGSNVDDHDDENGYDSDQDEEENPLLNDLSYESGAEKKNTKTSMWYNKEAFDFLKDSNDVNNEILNNLDLNYHSDDDDLQEQQSDDDLEAGTVKNGSKKAAKSSKKTTGLHNGSAENGDADNKDKKSEGLFSDI